MKTIQRPLIYYLRHGLTDWNAELRFQGRKDIALNATGRKQAKSNGKKLAKILDNPEEFNFVCSPMIRARETMEIVRKELGLFPQNYRIISDLIEYSYGELEGITLDDLEKDHPKYFAMRKKNRWTYLPPGGETMQQTMERIGPVFDSFHQKTVVVAHGTVGRTVRRHILGIPTHEATAFHFPQDKIFLFEGASETML